MTYFWFTIMVISRSVFARLLSPSYGVFELVMLDLLESYCNLMASYAVECFNLKTAL